MNILTIYAHPNPKSFCHAVLQQFTRGLADAGDSNEVIDFYAIGFDPVLGAEDAPNWMDENVPRSPLCQTWHHHPGSHSGTDKIPDMLPSVAARSRVRSGVP
jgi:NAD(P)H dehydrogenase (quinone)